MGSGQGVEGYGRVEMSQEYYLVCDECKNKVHLGCVGLSGFQFWSGDGPTMNKMFKLLDGCMFHFERLKFVWEQSKEDEAYKEVE